VANTSRRYQALRRRERSRLVTEIVAVTAYGPSSANGWRRAAAYVDSDSAVAPRASGRSDPV